VIFVSFVRFQVLTAARVKFRAFWNVLPCSQLDVDRRFRDACFLHHQGVLKSMSSDVSEVHAASIIRAM
jgi:hypothetical protein